jgi:release factor glutamine methyltransferase
VTDVAPAQTGRSVGCPVREAVVALAESLQLAGVSNPRRVAGDVVAAVLGVHRLWPVLNRDAALDTDTLARARAAVTKLAAGAPFGYAVGSAAFRHLILEVDERVLIPRPETELLVEQVLSRFNSRPEGQSWGTAVDIGTGSGAIAIALATEGKFDRIIATDTSIDAIAVARRNVERSRDSRLTRVELRVGSVTAPVRSERVQLVVSNPPYVAYSEIEALPAIVRDWEPPTALLSGANGMSITSAIIRESASILEPGGLLALEVDERRAALVAELAMVNGNYIAVGVGLDFTGRERFVFASRA